MLFLFFKFYKFFPVSFRLLVKRNSSISLYINREIVLLLENKDLEKICKIWDSVFFKFSHINLNALSVLTLETFLGESEQINKIIVKLCSHLVDDENGTLKFDSREDKRNYWLSQENNWVYTLIDLSVGKGEMSIYALSLLDEEIKSQRFCLNYEDVFILQFMIFAEKNEEQVNVALMLIALKEYLNSMMID